MGGAYRQGDGNNLPVHEAVETASFQSLSSPPNSSKPSQPAPHTPTLSRGPDGATPIELVVHSGNQISERPRFSSAFNATATGRFNEQARQRDRAGTRPVTRRVPDLDKAEHRRLALIKIVSHTSPGDTTNTDAEANEQRLIEEFGAHSGAGSNGKVESLQTNYASFATNAGANAEMTSGAQVHPPTTSTQPTVSAIPRRPAQGTSNGRAVDPIDAVHRAFKELALENDTDYNKYCFVQDRLVLYYSDMRRLALPNPPNSASSGWASNGLIDFLLGQEPLPPSTIPLSTILRSDANSDDIVPPSVLGSPPTAVVKSAPLR
jgi:hypothetical protein